MNEYEKAIFTVLIIVNLILFFKLINVEKFFFGNKCHTWMHDLDREIWGPHGWFFIHSVAFGYPQNPTNLDKNNAKKFIESTSIYNSMPKVSKAFQKKYKKLRAKFKFEI